MTQVSLTTSTNYSGPLNAVVEDEGTTLVIRFDLDEPAPASGLKVYIDSELNQSLNRLNLLGISVENINLGTLSSGLNGDNSGIAVDINAGATFATITLPVFDDPEPARSLPETFEGLTEVNYTLKTRDQVSASDLPIIERNSRQVSDYTVDSAASSSLVYFADTASQLPSTPTVSISASPTDLVEEDGTLMTLTINLSEPPPENGINVTIDSDLPNSLAQFDVLAATYNGAQLTGANSDASGFTVNVTQQTATIQLAPFDDDVSEGPTNITYTLQASDDYTINSAASSISINIEDNDGQSEPVVSFSVTPTTISEAQGTELVMNFSVDGDIPEEGITVKLEGDAARIMQQFTAAQTRFNDSGETFNRFDKGLVNNNVVGGTLNLFSLEDGDPSETASNPEAAGDAFLSNFTFTITEPTASITIPVIDDLFEEEDATYTYTLVEDDSYKVDDTANSATFTVTDGVVGGGGPTVGVSAAPTTLIESEQTALTLTFTTAGDIPPEGVVVVLEGPPRSIAEFDVNATNPRLPESETVVEGPVVTGGNIVGTNEVVGGLLFRITEPTATITVPVFQDEEQEGLEKLTFNLKDGELYNVDSDASSVSLTIEDGSVASEAVQVNEDGGITAFAYRVAGVAAGEEAKASISEEVLELSDAAFDNLVGFYEVVDENGGIDINGDGVADFNAGDDGYAKAALENALDGFALRVGGDTSNNTRASEFDAVVQGGKFYAPFAIANAGDLTVEEFLAINPNNDAATSIEDQVAYFAFGEANPDGAIHLQSRGNGIYGFEDLPDNLGVSDNDFNDAVFKFDFTA